MRLLTSCILAWSAVLLPPAVRAGAEAPDSIPFDSKTAVLASPASPQALAPGLLTDATGQVWLSWVEPAATGGRIRLARYDATAQIWRDLPSPRSRPHLLVAPAHPPQLVAGPGGQLALLWLETSARSRTRLWFSRTADDGATWSPPARLATAPGNPAFFTAGLLLDGRLLVAWLEPTSSDPAAPGRLLARIAGATADAALIDPSASVSSLDLAVFPDGSALLAYRGLATGHVRDIHLATWDQGHWSPGRVLNADDWQAPASPASGPRLAHHGGKVAAVWFTASYHTPQMLVSPSPDAGRRFVMPQSVDLGHPFGQPDVLLLADGSMLTVWREAGSTPGLYLRRMAPSLDLNDAVRLAILDGQPADAQPRLALVKPYDQTPGQIMVAYTQSATPSGVRTLLVTLPTLSSLVGRHPCLPCDAQDANASRGYAIIGRVVAAFPAKQLVQVRHEEIPGVMRAMTMDLRVDPADLPRLVPGQQLLARIERRGRNWWLFDLKLLGSPPLLQPVPHVRNTNMPEPAHLAPSSDHAP